MDYLEEVVRQAREQKHGTMVVITDYDTAISELKTLKKQSILIESIEIMPEYIEFLTSKIRICYSISHFTCGWKSYF
ncbi:hypothetical protein [Peribacillus frigoritolerans]|uniref:hypothetical protein n=1 Tax=Peribacillus castrilensis TaxID=2897690 RepID=UPI002DD2AA5E|nr:hypothetical protein [Peribacillus castrilensis]